MKLVLMEFMTLDGVTQGPGSPEEDTSDGFTAGGWLVPHIDDIFMATVLGWSKQAEAFLFGRRTYEAFSRDWPQMTDPDDPFAPIMNGLPKFVAARSPLSAEWQPATVLAGDTVAEVATLKERPGGELQVHGSTTLARSLFAAGLIDELRLVIAPVVIGAGRRLFPADGAPGGLKLLSSQATPGGLMLQTYQWDGTPRQGTYSTSAATDA